MSKSFFKLSGGMKQKLLIAIAVSKNSDILIFDEPLRGIDPLWKSKLIKLIKEFKNNDKTIIVSSHILPEIESITENIILIHQGKIFAEGNIHYIRDLGKKAGAVLNPATSLSTLDYILEDVDLIMLMSVNPRFGGQSFIQSTLAKIRELRGRLDAVNPDAGIEIDGGISPTTIAEVAAAGANIFVAGSAVYGQADYGGVITRLKELARSAGT
jgi:ribulose-phosphate 3-epimerase